MSDLIKEVLVKFNLPFAIDLPDDIYDVKGNEYFCRVALHKKLSIDNPSGWNGDPRIPDDRFGHTNYSEVVVNFAREKPIRIDSKLPEHLKKFSIDAINRMLDICRWLSDDHFNHDVVEKDVTSFNFQFFDENKNDLKKDIVTMRGPIRIGTNSPFDEKTLSELKDRLAKGVRIPFEIELIKNAKDHQKFADYRMASIEIQNAVEFVIAKIMVKFLQNQGKQEVEINDVLADGFKRYKMVFKNATSESITGTNEYTQWQNKCAKLRHMVLHRGKIPTESESDEAITAGINFLKILEQYVTS